MVVQSAGWINVMYFGQSASTHCTVQVPYSIDKHILRKRDLTWQIRLILSHPPAQTRAQCSRNEKRSSLPKGE